MKLSAAGVAFTVFIEADVRLGDVLGRLNDVCIPAQTSACAATFTITSNGQTITAEQDGTPIACSPDGGSVGAAVQTHIERLVLDRSSFVFVHAGVVTIGHRAVVLPGDTMAGKSSLVDALLDRGATYYSDEFAVLDDDGRVLPFPRALHRRGAPDEWFAPPHRSTAPANVALTAFVSYDPGAAFQPRPVSPAEATLLLLRHTMSPKTDRVLTVLASLAQQAPAVASARDEAAEAADALMAIALDG